MPEASRGPREGPQSYPWAFQGPPEASRRHPGPKTIQSKKIRHLKILTLRWSIHSLLIFSAVPGAAAPQQGRSGGGGGGPSSCAFAWFLRGEVRGGGSPPGMSREAPKGKKKSQGRSRYCEIAQSSLKHYPGRRSCRCRLRCPKRKQEKPREVKILWNSSAEPGPKPHKSATARPPP